MSVGISTRDYFAAAALPGVIAARTALSVAGITTDINQESIAEECFELADAMVAERTKSDPAAAIEFAREFVTWYEQACAAFYGDDDGLKALHNDAKVIVDREGARS